MEQVNAIAVAQRGELMTVYGDKIIVAVNVGVAAAQPAPRVALIAMEIVRYLDSEHIAANAGVADGLSFVSKQYEATTLCGPAADNAVVALNAGEAAGVRCAALLDTAHDDVEARVHVITFGAVDLPFAARRPLRALVDERQDTGGEWLYVIGSAHTSIMLNEQTWSDYTQRGITPPADAITTIEAYALGLKQHSEGEWARLAAHASVTALRGATLGEERKRSSQSSAGR
jgi:hypothetical protein